MRRACAWLLFAAACATYALLSLAAHKPFHPVGGLGYFDLRVYRGAAHLLLNGGALYDTRIVRWAHFTYPPIAAIAFTPLAVAPLAVDEVLVSALTVAALVVLLRVALELPWGRGERDRGVVGRAAWPLAALAAAAALWLEPITTTLGHGQINVLVALLIVADLARGDTARSKGALIGLAAGLKLTPLIFVPYLLLSRRLRAALVALAMFAATIAFAFAVVPTEARRYWGGLFLDSTRAGGCCTPSNQSLRGAIVGLDPSFAGPWMVVLAIIVGFAGIACAALASRRGDEATGFSICALTGLLASPVSWTHHWTLVVPALLVLGVRACRRRSVAGLIGTGGLLLAGYSYLPEIVTTRYPSATDLSVVWTLASDSYVLIGVVALVVASATTGFAARRT